MFPIHGHRFEHGIKNAYAHQYHRNNHKRKLVGTDGASDRLSCRSTILSFILFLILHSSLFFSVSLVLSKAFLFSFSVSFGFAEAILLSHFTSNGGVVGFTNALSPFSLSFTSMFDCLLRLSNSLDCVSTLYRSSCSFSFRLSIVMISCWLL